jgi:two-component system LytT family response regulator
MIYSAMIIDDERPARKRVADLLRTETDMRVIAQCDDVFQARDILQRERPEIMFLDIQMPEASGFDLLEMLPDGLEPAVIFTTAHEEHALRAFGVNAVDYLLKPFTKERFQTALKKARRFLKALDRSSHTDLASAQDLERRIFVKDGQRVVWLRLAEIDWVEAAQNYVVLHAGSARHFMRWTLHGFEAQLPRGTFVRVSRSALIAASRLKGLRPGRDGKSVAVLQNGDEVPITRRLTELRAELEAN